jgi:hypothetical protein
VAHIQYHGSPPTMNSGLFSLTRAWIMLEEIGDDTLIGKGEEEKLEGGLAGGASR